MRIPVAINGCRLIVGVLVTMMGGQAWSETFVLPPGDTDLVGSIQTVVAEHEDTLLDIARQFGLGYEDIVRANPGVDPWIPGEGTEVLLPTRFILPPGPREGIVLNLPEYRLYYYPKPKKGESPVVQTFPISIGRQDWTTPLGRTKVTAKVKDPSWFPPDSIREEHAADGRPLPKIVPPGPGNPLGRYAMRLGLPGYLIHGTNRPAGVGMRVTHGCIRMYPENIEQLFDIVPVNTPVQIINEPYKLGWVADSLYLEIHPPLFEHNDEDARSMTSVTRLLVNATRDRAVPVDWDKAQNIFDQAKGIPQRMSKQSELELRVATR